jgi:GT2 family glycosyltransferase
MTVSIIIAVKTWQKNLEECVAKCLELDYPDFEIIILPDETFPDNKLPSTNIPIKVISTGQVSPAQKRDMALTHAKGEILAFIDDDSFPGKDWLKNALVLFEGNNNVAAVGGPAVTPPNDSFVQRASGNTYSSMAVSGTYIYRYVPKKMQEVDDYPTCNFLVRKSVMQELGGFKTKFWPGEDTKLCLEITKKLGKKIIYDPKVLIYHHRRPLFLPHLRQIASYALHRGYFVKKYPQTSLRLPYFLPTIFLFAVITGGILSIFSTYFKKIYFWGLSFYLLLVLLFSISRELRQIPLVFLGIISTHLTYGFYFLRGLIVKRLKEET